MICEIAISTAMTCGGTNTTRGESEAARFVAEQARKGRQQIQRSLTLGSGIKAVLIELRSVAESAAAPNWDGYGATPVSAQTYRQAYFFAESLPVGVPPPSVGVEPDGQLTFEWYRGPRRLLSVSVSSDGDLHYAALLGHNKAYGTEAFIGEFPKPILELVQRVCAG